MEGRSVNVNEEKIPDRLMPFVHSHLGLAQSIAIKIYKPAAHALELDELKSVAYFGLCDGTRRWPKYCTDRGLEENPAYFTAYVVPRIRGAVYDFIRTRDWATRSLRDKSKKIRLADKERNLTPEELAELTGMTVEEIQSTIAAISKVPISLENITDKSTEESEGVYGFQLADNEDVESTSGASDILRLFVNCVEELDPEQQVVLVMRYYEEMDLKVVAAEVGISESRVSSLHTSAILSILNKMKEEMTLDLVSASDI